MMKSRYATLSLVKPHYLVDGAHASAATNEAEAQALFTKFAAAQNAHSVSAVKAMRWNSRGTLLLARGAEIRVFLGVLKSRDMGTRTPSVIGRRS
jgi:hypothetical protein